LHCVPVVAKLPILRERRAVRADPPLRTDEAPIDTHSTIVYKSNRKPLLGFIQNPVFGTDGFLSVPKTGLARASAQWPHEHADVGACPTLWRQSLRGRRPVRAQAAIVYKSPALSLFLSITAFSAQIASIREEGTVDVRAARNVCP